MEATTVFDITELRKEILSYCNGATLYPLKCTNRAFKATIDELLSLINTLTYRTHRILPCCHAEAISIGCIRCINHMVNKQGVNLCRLVRELVEAEYYGLVMTLAPRLEFETATKSRYYWNSIHTLLYNKNTCQSVEQVKKLIKSKQRKSRLLLLPEYTYLYSQVEIMELVIARTLPVSAIIHWLQNTNIVINQIELTNTLMENIGLITSVVDTFNNIVISLFNRGFNSTGLTLLTSVGSYYYFRHSHAILAAAISAPNGDFGLFMSVCEHLRNYTMTQERFYLCMIRAIESGKYDTCVELKKVAIVCGLRYNILYSHYLVLSNIEQVRCANVFDDSATCNNVIGGIITATEYTADCVITSTALMATLGYDSPQFHRRAAFLSVLFSGALDYMSKLHKYRFYYILTITPDSVMSIVNNHTTNIDYVVNDLYKLYIEYGPHPYPNFYSTLLNQANTTFSKLLLGFLSDVCVSNDISDDDLNLISYGNRKILLEAATCLKVRWWYERLYNLGADWAQLRAMQLETCCYLFYKPNGGDKVAKRKRKQTIGLKKNVKRSRIG
ncbi:Hypothetical protein FSTVST1_21 [Faustovirus ST1]|nr:Hypothetical protein FSTVST1_21 [Faustovirus ST1]